MGRWSRGTRENRRAILASSVLMQIAHRAHAALVELVEELNERSSERGPWALTVQPGCNIATVRKCMMMIKHGPRDREFIEAVVERGNELVRPIDLARMMRSGEEWASEDHGVIFYRLVRVLNGARAIAPDETEFGRRDDAARDVQEAMTHAAELGFVVLHEGKAYTDHMHEITIPNGSRFGASRHLPEIKKANKPSFGTKGHKRDMVRKIEINEVDKGKKTKEKKEKVCCPVFVSGDTRFLVKCIGTMRNTETPVQVEGVHLTERLVCKHVTLYHPAGWPRRKQDLCAHEKAEDHKIKATSMSTSVDKWREASEAFIQYAKDYRNDKITTIKEQVDKLKQAAESNWEQADDQARLKDIRDASELKGRILNELSTSENHIDDLKANVIDNLNKTMNIDKNRSFFHREDVMFVTALDRISDVLSSDMRVTYGKLSTVDKLHVALTELRLLYHEKDNSHKRGWFKKSVATRIHDKMSSIKNIKVSSHKNLDIKTEMASYNTAFSEIDAAFKRRAQELSDYSQAEEQQREEAEKQTETQEEAGSRDEPDLNRTQVPQDADMCVAVQVSGELFRIVHLTRDVETQREKKAKREEEEGEEAKKAKKTKRAQKEEKAEKAEEGEIKKYDDAGYAKQMKEDKDGDKHKVRLDADYNDYKECVSAARKYLEETCIVNDTTESWSSAAWRLTKGCREEASGTGGSSGTSGSANFGELEASDRLELVLVPRNLFGHVYGKGHEPTYEGKAEISKDGIWIYEANGRGKVCPKCAVCENSEHKRKKNASGLFVLYNKSDKNLIRGLSSRFCFHQPV